jgi:zinc transporter ZupT
VHWSVYVTVAFGLYAIFMCIRRSILMRKIRETRNMPEGYKVESHGSFTCEVKTRAKLISILLLALAGAAHYFGFRTSEVPFHVVGMVLFIASVLTMRIAPTELATLRMSVYGTPDLLTAEGKKMVSSWKPSRMKVFVSDRILPTAQPKLMIQGPTRPVGGQVGPTKRFTI